MTTSATKVNARKFLTQTLFINTPTLHIRASLTLEKHHGKFSDEIQIIVEQIKTVQYLFNCTHCQNSEIVQYFNVLKPCKQSLESILIKEKRRKLNTQIALNEKAKLLTIY